MWSEDMNPRKLSSVKKKRNSRNQGTAHGPLSCATFREDSARIIAIECYSSYFLCIYFEPDLHLKSNRNHVKRLFEKKQSRKILIEK